MVRKTLSVMMVLMESCIYMHVVNIDNESFLSFHHHVMSINSRTF